MYQSCTNVNKITSGRDLGIFMEYITVIVYQRVVICPCSGIICILEIMSLGIKQSITMLLFFVLGSNIK